MPIIGELLTREGCSQTGADFYFLPNQNPHPHIRVGTATTVVTSLAGC